MTDPGRGSRDGDDGQGSMDWVRGVDGLGARLMSRHWLINQCMIDRSDRLSSLSHIYFRALHCILANCLAEVEIFIRRRLWRLPSFLFFFHLRSPNRLSLSFCRLHFSGSGSNVFSPLDGAPVWREHPSVRVATHNAPLEGCFASCLIGAASQSKRLDLAWLHVSLSPFPLFSFGHIGVVFICALLAPHREQVSCSSRTAVLLPFDLFAFFFLWTPLVKLVANRRVDGWMDGWLVQEDGWGIRLDRIGSDLGG